jgi:hypothetical protein
MKIAVRMMKELPYQRMDEELTVPEIGRFVRLKHWNELGRAGSTTPYPEIINRSDGLLTINPYTGMVYDYVELTDEWQWFMWDFWAYAAHYRLPKGKIEWFYWRPNNDRVFAQTTHGSQTYVYVDMVEAHRAFTEAASPEAGARDVVTGRNLGNPRGYEWLLRPTGGAMCKVIRDLGTQWELEAIDLLKPVPEVADVFSRPWLYFWCTQYDTVYGSTRFPQIKNANAVHGLPIQGTPAPLLSLGGSIPAC